MLDSSLERILSKAGHSQLPVEMEVATNSNGVETKNSTEAEVRLVVKFTIEEQIVYKGRVEQVNLLDSEELSRVVSKVAWDDTKEVERKNENNDDNEARSRDDGSQEKSNSKNSDTNETPHETLEEHTSNQNDDLQEKYSTQAKENPKPIQEEIESQSLNDIEIIPSNQEIDDCSPVVTQTKSEEDCDSNKNPILTESETDVAKKVVSSVIDSVFKEQEAITQKEALTTNFDEQQAAITPAVDFTDSHSLDAEENGISTNEVVIAISETGAQQNDVLEEPNQCIIYQHTDIDEAKLTIKSEIDFDAPIHLNIEMQPEEVVIEESHAQVYGTSKEKYKEPSTELSLPSPKPEVVQGKKFGLKEQSEGISKKEESKDLKEDESATKTTALKRRSSLGQSNKRPRKMAKERGSASKSTRESSTPKASTTKVSTSLLANSYQERPTTLRLFAKWTDNHFYPGTILRSTKEKKFDVSFYDGATRSVSETDLIPINNIIGKQVRLSISRNYCVNAVVYAQITSVNDQPMFEVEYQQDGVMNRKSVPFKDIFLTGDQGMPLVSQPDRTTGGANFADVDLDNIIYEKRSRRFQDMDDYELVENNANGGRRKRGQHGMKVSSTKTKNSTTEAMGLVNSVEQVKNHEKDVQVIFEEKTIEDKTNQEVLKPTPMSTNSNSATITTGSSSLSGAENVPKIELDEEFYFANSSSHRATNTSLLL